MADLATLQIAVDSRPVAKASNDLDGLGRSANAAEKASYTLSNSQKSLQAAFASSNKAVIDATKYINQLQDETRRLSNSAYDLKKYEIAAAAAAAPTVELKNQVRAAGAEMLRAMKSTNDHAGALNAMTPRTRLASHEVLQLSYNVQDLAVQLLSGSPPMMAFAQQGSQIAGSMQASELGVKGFAKAVGLMVLDITKALAVNPYFLALAAAVTVATVSFNAFQNEVAKSGELTKYAESLGLTEKEMKKLGPVGIEVMDVVKGIWKTISEGLNLGPVFSGIADFFKGLYDFLITATLNVAAGIYAAFVGSYNTIVKTWDMLPAVFADLGISAANFIINGLEAGINKAIDLINGLAVKANKILATLEMPTIPVIAYIDIPNIENSFAGSAKKMADVGVAEFTKAFNDAKSGMSKIGETVSDNIVSAAKERIATSAKEIIDDRADKDLKDKAGKSGKDAGEKMAEEFAKALADTMSVLAGEYNTFSIATRMNLEVTGDVEELLGKINADRKKTWDEEQKILKDNYDFAVKGAQEIGDLIGGAFGQGVKDLSTVLARDFPALMESLGGAFKGLVNSLDGVLASLGTSFKELGAFGAVGGAAASMTGGSQLGGTIGGGIGGVLGQSLSFLGKFGGPIGSIAGGILGGIIGGLFKKTKQASATIQAMAGSLNVAGIVGNDAGFKTAVSGLAKSVIGGIEKIAQSLGGEIEGAFKMSIGQRDKKFVVDPFGQGRTKGSGVLTFETEAEAIAYAIDSAIRGGILGGLKTGTQALLRGAGDLEDRLQKALDFEGVFNALKGETNPLGLALENLDKRFKALILTFQEAGASSEDWAELEKYYQIEREKAIREGNAKAIEAVNAARDQLTEAYNRESEAILTTLERFQSLTADLESFRLSLAEQLMTAEEIYKSAKASFDEVAKLAVEGNEKAISDLISVSQKYLDSAKNFLTPEEYNREIENVMKAVDLAIAQTKTMEDYAQLQLDALNNSVDGLITLNDSVLSVRDAIAALKDAQSKVGVAPATTLVFAAPKNALPDFTKMTQQEIVNWYMNQTGATQVGGGVAGPTDYNRIQEFASGGYHSGGLRIVGENGPELEVTGPSRIYNANQTASMLSGGAGVEQQISALRDEMKASLYAIAKNTGKTSDQLMRWDGDGMPEVRDWTV